jgi:hypothetical protein
MNRMFKVTVGKDVVYNGDSLEKAIRAWDHATYDKAHVVEGGIEVREYDAAHIMVREGWVLHVNADGVLAPSIGGRCESADSIQHR